MKLQKKRGSTNVRLMVFIADSSSTTGAGKTGLAYNSSGIKWYYWRGDTGDAGGVSVTLANATRGTFTSGGFKEIDATNLPGFYEIGVPDAALASGSPSVVMMLHGVTNMAPLPIEIQLVAYDPDDAAGLGLTNLDATVSSRLAPTTAGRTLDVSTGGEAGIDWANVGSPTATVGLSGTTVGVVTTLTNAPSDSSGVGTLLTRLSGTRAGYLDNLSGGAVALASGVIVTTNNDKTGYELTSGERTAIANEVEAQIINDSDSEKVLEAITDKIAAVNPDLGGLTVAAIAAGVRLNLATELGRIDASITSRLAGTSYTAPLSAAETRTALGLASANLDTQLGNLPTAAENATATWSATTSGWSGGQMGEVLISESDYVTSIADVTNKLDTTLEADGDNWKLTADSLQEVPGGSAPTTNQIVSALVASDWAKRSAAILYGKLEGAGTGEEIFYAEDGETVLVRVTATKRGNRTEVAFE